MRKLMMRLALVAAGGALALGTALPAAHAASNLPAATVEVPPLIGANSFTESQAKTRIEAEGFTKVSTLVLDKEGIWRGTAEIAGKSIQIAVDFKGNVVSSMAGPTMSNDGSKAATEVSKTPIVDMMLVTEAGAKARMEAAGYSSVTGIMKDASGVWHATAMKDGASKSLMLDQTGAVLTN